MTGRAALPPRRMLETFDFVHDGMLYTVGLGRAPAHPVVREIFLNAGKDGSTIGTLARDAAILASLLLQYGCPLDVVRHALSRNPDNSPAGPIGLVLDYVAKEAV